MYHTLKPYYIALIVLPFLGLGAMHFIPVRQQLPIGSKLQQQEDIQEVVLVQRMLAGNIPNNPTDYYVSVEGQDVSPSFAARFTKYNAVLRPCSETTMLNGQVVEKASGKPSIVYEVGRVNWTSPLSATVEVSDFFANLGASSQIYPVKWSGGHWGVGKAQMGWIA